MSKPRILVIENSIAITGALKAIANTISQLQPSFSFFFILPKSSVADDYLKDLKLEAVEKWRMMELRKEIKSLILYLPMLFINAIRLKRFLKIHQIDLIHVNDLYNLLPPMARILGCKVPYICHVRFMPDAFPEIVFNFWLRVHMRYSYKIIAVSQILLKKLPVHEKLVMINDGLPFENGQEKMEEKTNGTDNHTFLYVANMIEGKGQNFALDAFSLIHEQLPGWKLRFVGGDMGLKKNKEYIELLKSKSEKLKVANKIEWKGFTNDIEWEYKHADIVLNFSESESFSMTCLEALYFGRPMIASESGGPSEIIENNVTGILVTNGDSRAMSEAMKKVAMNKNRREEMGLKARAVVRQKFSTRNTSSKLEDLYDRILSGNDKML